MLIVVISIAIAGFIAYKFAESMWGDFSDWVVGSLIGVLAGFAFWFLGSLLLSSLLPKTIEYTNRDLVAIQDGTPTGGAFFLGSGVVGSEPRYTYYVKDGEAKILRSTGARGVRVFENADRAYVRDETGCKSDFGWIAECAIFGGVKEIHVPKGTIKQNYVLDAQ